MKYKVIHNGKYVHIKGQLETENKQDALNIIKELEALGFQNVLLQECFE